MNSVQESKNELEAAIRYAENAISSAQGTIESMEFRQEMAKKQYAEQTGREEALTKKVQELEDKVQGQYDDIKQLEYDLTAKTAQASAWKKEVDKLKAEVEFYTKKYNELAQQKDDLEAQVNALEQPERPTMPVIPKDVAIAIFREGVQHGVEAACTEIDMDTYIRIEESEYVGDFHVTFERDIDLNDHIDTDWMRGKCGDYDEKSVIEALKNLCADKEFECRIHGIDDNE
jgi:predicted RNase H-like nuclease (RuvC/YqgF family)